jgi:membrane protease YdiL (CAAX protease family)
MFGLVAGFLYWKKGLEAAIIAHITTHVVLVTAIRLAM